jgi:hypothetical protein
MPDTHACEAAHEVPTVCNLMVEGEAPEAATGKSLKEVHMTSTQMGVSRDIDVDIHLVVILLDLS